MDQRGFSKARWVTLCINFLEADNISHDKTHPWTHTEHMLYTHRVVQY